MVLTGALTPARTRVNAATSGPQKQEETMRENDLSLVVAEPAERA